MNSITVSEPQSLIELDSLIERAAKHLASLGYKHGTIRNYQCIWKKFTQFSPENSKKKMFSTGLVFQFLNSCGISEYSYYNCSEALATLNILKYGSAPLKVMVLVDGPPKVTCKNARYPALTHVMPHFQHAKIDILLDDYSRPDEKETVKLWRNHLDNAQIPHRQIDLKFEKGACLLQINFNKSK